MEPKKILIIDDDIDLAETISIFVEILGFEPVVVNSCKDAQMVLAEINPAVIITDIVMPDMDGIELLKWFAENNYTNPIILMSGYDGKYLGSTKSLALARGCSIIGTLCKPFTLNDLEKIFKNYSGKDELSPNLVFEHLNWSGVGASSH